MPPFHEAKHLTRQATHLQSFPVEFPAEGIQSSHNFADGAITVIARMLGLGVLRFYPNSRIGLLHHLLAIVHADQIVLEKIVVKHVFSGFTEIYNPIGERRRQGAKRHVLRIHRTRRVVISADPANAAGNEVSVPRIFASHEHAVAAKYRRGAITFDNFAIVEIDLGENSQTPDDSRNRVPVHFDEVTWF